MPKCKICRQNENWLYWLFRSQMCVHCYCELDRKLNPLKLSKEDIKRMKVSEKAVKNIIKDYETKKQRDRIRRK